MTSGEESSLHSSLQMIQLRIQNVICSWARNVTLEAVLFEKAGTAVSS